jgi:hypothetical protein
MTTRSAECSWPTGATGRRIVQLLALCCVGLIPWTIGLALTLPSHYLVVSWPLAWTGFDLLLLGCLSTTAWALWKQRQVAIPASMITSVLLVCDAWFDILTAHGGRCLTVSIATALIAELPLAGLLGVISIRLLHATLRAAAHRVDPGTPSPQLWRMALVTAPDAGGERSNIGSSDRIRHGSVPSGRVDRRAPMCAGHRDNRWTEATGHYRKVRAYR